MALTAIALVTMPIARDPAVAWETFNDPFIKAVVIFVGFYPTRAKATKVLATSSAPPASIVRADFPKP